MGDTQPAEVHALVHAINAKLGNVGKTVTYIDPVAASAPEGKGGTLVDLVKDMNAGKVETLMIFGGNPVYDAPVDLDIKKALRKVPFKSTSACTTTRPACCASGTCRSPTSWKVGATFEDMTAPCRSFSL